METFFPRIINITVQNMETFLSFKVKNNLVMVTLTMLKHDVVFQIFKFIEN